MVSFKLEGGKHNPHYTMKILQVISSLDPQNGGPVTAALSQSQEMIKQGHLVDFVTFDNPNDLYLNNVPGHIYALGKAFSGYGVNAKLKSWLSVNGSGYDAAIIHGLWQYLGLVTWLTAPQTGLNYFIYPHGSLDPWFKHTYPIKHIKKWIYWQFFEKRIIRDSQGLIFTCEEEKSLAHQTFTFTKTNEIVAPFGLAFPADDSEKSIVEFYKKFPDLKGKHLLLFLGRIHPKKGCDLLIKSLKQAKALDPDIHLVMAGPDQIGWAPKLKELAQELGVADQITWPGMLTGEMKLGALRASQAFILPSHSENFGLAVIESLSCSLPVLATNKVNIWCEIAKDNAGIIEEDDLPGVIKLLELWIKTSKEQRGYMRQNAVNCFKNRFEIQLTTKRTIQALQECLNSAENESHTNN